MMFYYKKTKDLSISKNNIFTNKKLRYLVYADQLYFKVETFIAMFEP